MKYEYAEKKNITKRKIETYITEDNSNYDILVHAADSPLGTSSCCGCAGMQHTVMLDLDCAVVLVTQVELLPSLPLVSPSQPAFKRGSMYLRVAELLGRQANGTHIPSLQVMIDKHEEGACFWVRCYLSTPAQSHDSTNPSAFKFRHPDSPLNLLSS